MARRTVKVFSRALQVDGASQCGTWTTWSALLNLHPESEPVLLFTTTNKNNAIGEIDPAAADGGAGRHSDRNFGHNLPADVRCDFQNSDPIIKIDPIKRTAQCLNIFSI